MLRGRIVETGPAESVFGAPRHPYTQALLSALPIPDPVRERLRQRIVFDPRDFQPAPDAALREVAPRHFVLD
jgi:oligopeptide/dipeptide ABC transporter ATP-binding protein